MASENAEPEPHLNQLARFFNKPVDQYTTCPNCRCSLREHGTVHIEFPTDGHTILIHVLMECGECDWRRVAEFEPAHTGVPPTRESVIESDTPGDDADGHK